MSKGFSYDDQDGSTLAAIKSSAGHLVLSAAFGEKDFDANVCIELPQDRAVEFARWILGQYAAPEGGPRIPAKMAPEMGDDSWHEEYKQGWNDCVDAISNALPGGASCDRVGGEPSCDGIEPQGETPK